MQAAPQPSTESNDQITVDLQLDARQLLAASSSSLQWLRQHSLIIDQGSILDMVPTHQVPLKYQAKQHYVLNNHLLIPALSNHYCSLGSSLFQHLGFELPTQIRWQNHLMPTEQKFVSEELVETATEYALAQSLVSGTSNFSSHYFYPNITAKVAKKYRINCKIGICINPSSSLPNLSSEQQLARGLQLIDDFKHQAHIEFGFSIPDLSSVSDDFLKKLGSVSNELALSLDVSLNGYLNSSKQNSKRPLQRLMEFGLLSPDLNIHNPRGLQRQELTQMAKFGCKLTVSPSAACLVANGYPSLAEFAALGGDFLLGSDNLTSNNFDLFKEMHCLALTSKLIANSATVLDADQVLTSALKPTLSSATADKTSIGFSKGSEASICALDLNHPLPLDQQAAIVHDPSQQIVYTGGQHNISHFWHKGKAQIIDGKAVNAEITEPYKTANQWLKTISQQKY